MYGPAKIIRLVKMKKKKTHSIPTVMKLNLEFLHAF